MRSQPLKPELMSPAVRAFHDRIVKDQEKNFSGFTWRQQDGALVGPFPPLLNHRQYGEPAWAYISALIEHSKLPKTAHEVAVLVVGTHFGADYELYAHSQVAQQVGLEQENIERITSKQRPLDLPEQEDVAYEFASVLSRGDQLSQELYERGKKALGSDLVSELIFLIGGYCLLSVILNGYQVPVPKN